MLRRPSALRLYGAGGGKQTGSVFWTFGYAKSIEKSTVESRPSLQRMPMWTVVAKKQSGLVNRLISGVATRTVSLPAELTVVEVVTTCPVWSSKLLKPISVVFSETRDAFGSRKAR